MPIFFADVLQHSNAVNPLVDSNYVKGGIRSSHATLQSLLDSIDATLSDGQVGNVSAQLKELSTMVWIGNASSGEFYVLTDYSQRDTSAGWTSLSTLVGAVTTVSVADSSDAAGPFYLTLSGVASGPTSLKTDESITYNASTNVLTATATAAQKWSTARTVTFAGGDVTGSFSIDGSANVSNVGLTIAAGSVALGTDTSGNYVQSVTTPNNSGLVGGVTAGIGTNPSIQLSINNLTAVSALSTLVNNDAIAIYAGGNTQKVNISRIATYVLSQATGHISFDASNVATLNIPDDYIALGTKTSGTYVSTLAEGTGITLTNGTTGADGATYTVALDYFGSNSFINAATESTDVLESDWILFADASDSYNVKKTLISDLPFSNTDGTVTSISATGSVSGITLSTGGSAITSSGTITLGGAITGLTNTNLAANAGILNTQLANDSITIGSTEIALGQSATSIEGLTGLDFTADNATIAGSIGSNSLTLGGASSTVVIPGSLSVAGNVTYVNTDNTYFKDNFIQLNRPATGGPVALNTLTYAGIYVYDQTTATEIVTEANSPGIQYDYANEKWQIRNVQSGSWENIITTSTQTTLTEATVAETLNGSITGKYVAPDGLRSWTAYTQSGIGITFPGSGVSNAAGTTEVQYAKTVKATATVTADDANAGYFAIYHGLGNVYPIVNVYVADGNDYYQVIPKLIVDDADNIKVYINGMIASTTYYIGITG